MERNKQGRWGVRNSHSDTKMNTYALKFIGQHTTIFGWVKFIRPENIWVGDNARIEDFTMIAGGRGDNLTIIGDHCRVCCYSSILGNAGVTLVGYVGISPGCRLFSTSEAYVEPTLAGPTVMQKYRIQESGRILMERFTLLGANCVVLPGVTIGEGASVGACSLVKEDIEPWTLNAGVPTRQIKKRDKNKVLEMYQKMIEEQK